MFTTIQALGWWNILVAYFAAKDPIRPANCFPALGFSMPANTPNTIDGWWCNQSDEYAFLGFSYEVTECQSLDKLRREFKDVRNAFDGRYVRLYGACDRSGFYDDIVAAAWEAGIGVHALIWFGFDGDDKWIRRRNTLLSTLHSNPRAKFVTRLLQFGSEPLFDWVLEPHVLAGQIWDAKANLSRLSIPVTISELAYGYQSHNGAQPVLDAIDVMGAHILPFFSWRASTANNSWRDVSNDLTWFIEQGRNRKIYFSQNGWPSETSEGVQPNSPDAVANIKNEADYYNLLDSECSYLKTVAGGGVGWFAHIYSDNQEPGYGIYNSNGGLKFDFRPRTSC